MHIDVLNERLIAINAEKEEKERLAIIEYCKSHRTHKIGDVVTNGTTTILCDLMTCNVLYRKYSNVYHGVELKKNGEPKKSGERGQVWIAIE